MPTMPVWLTSFLSILAVVLALGVPLFVEHRRRPRLRVELAPDSTFGGHDDPYKRPASRLVHVRIVNEPMKGPWSRWLLTNHAISCKVTIKFLRNGVQVFDPIPGRWSSTPQPLQVDFGIVNGFLLPITRYNQEAVPQTLRFDLPPDPAGEVVAFAMKVQRRKSAYAFSSESYQHPGLEHPDWRLPLGDYEVEIQAYAGSEIRSNVLTLLLQNPGVNNALEVTPQAIGVETLRLFAQPEPWAIVGRPGAPLPAPRSRPRPPT
jgi:hypothetical protein